MMILATFFSWLFPSAAAAAAVVLLLLLPLKKAPAGRGNTMAVKDGKAPKSSQKLPNVTSETHRK